jgi:DNA-binding NarL/FixJ family response regulator
VEVRPETGSSGPWRVVIVDDSTTLRDVLRRTLDLQHDFHVVGEAVNGRAGIAVVRAHRPDVVLLDLSMPEMDGLEALRPMRAASPASIVIVFTGYPESVAALSAVEQGAHGFVVKGGSVSDMLARIRDVISVRRATVAHAITRKAAAETPPATTGLVG